MSGDAIFATDEDLNFADELKVAWFEQLLEPGFVVWAVDFFDEGSFINLTYYTWGELHRMINRMGGYDGGGWIAVAEFFDEQRRFIHHLSEEDYETVVDLTVDLETLGQAPICKIDYFDFVAAGGSDFLNQN